MKIAFQYEIGYHCLERAMTRNISIPMIERVLEEGSWEHDPEKNSILFNLDNIYVITATDEKQIKTVFRRFNK